MASLVKPATDPSRQGVDWSHRFVAVYKCSAPPQRSDSGTAEKTIDKLVVGDRDALLEDPNLLRVVRSLHEDFLKKREYKYADNPTTRVMTFKNPEKRKGIEVRRTLDRLRRARSLEKVESAATELASLYLDTPGARAGVLLFLVSRGALAGEAAGNVSEDCVFIFKCDFEPVAEVAPEDLFHQIEDAIIEKAKKAAVYPRFDPDLKGFDDSLVRIFDEKGETQYWLDYLQLGDRKFERTAPGDAIRQALDQSHEDLVERHGEEWKDLPRRRPLDDRKRAIPAADRISTQDAQKVARQAAVTSGEAVMVTFSLGAVRVSAPEDQYGRSWILAEEGDQRYLLVKGDHLEVRTKRLTNLDVTRFESLEKAAEHLEMECG